MRIREKKLYKAIFSMNFHEVAVPEGGVADARCYIFFFREGDKLTAYIALYLPQSGKTSFYTYSANPFAESELPLVEDAARAFGDEMGFFLDEKNFADLSIVEQNAWIDEQPIFGYISPSDRAAAEQQSEQASQGETHASVTDRSKSAAAESPAALASQESVARPLVGPAPVSPAPPVKPAAAAPRSLAEPPAPEPSRLKPAPAARPASARTVSQPVAKSPVIKPTVSPDEILIEPQIEEEAAPPAFPKRASVESRISTEKKAAPAPAGRTTQPAPVAHKDHDEETISATVETSKSLKQTVHKRNANSAVRKDLEALARLLASF